VTSSVLFAGKLISMHLGPVTLVYEMLDELGQIRARKMAEMAQRAQARELSSQVRAPVELTDHTFESTIRSNRLVVVDCWAAWCYPCRLVAPIVEELANEYRSVALFAKLNVDDNPATAMRYSIQSIPTLLIIKDGVEVDRIVGALPKDEIEAILRKYV